jgi:hypothetical protein
VADDTNNPTSAKPVAPAARSLQTKQQVIVALQAEVDAASLTAIALMYEIAPQQLSDILRGRANLSKRALGKLRYKLHEFYEKVAKA